MWRIKFVVPRSDHCTRSADTYQAGALVILDEVMTSRLAPGGLQSLVGIKPDLTTFGKYLGGGLAFGAFGGRADIMAVYDPRLATSLGHSGTFNNNTLVMHAGHAGLTRIFTPEVCIAHNARGDALRERLRAVSAGTKLAFTGLGSMLGIHFWGSGRQDVERAEDEEEDTSLKELFWMEMLEAGFWVVKRGFMALVLDTPQDELDRFVKCVEGFLGRHEALIKI